MSIESTLSAPSSKSNRTRREQSSASGKAQVLSEVASLPLLGEIVTWQSARRKKILFDDVKKALVSSGHEEKYAKEFTPATAFTRAAKQLQEERLIHEVGRTDDEVIFQFTKTGMKKVSAKEGEKTFALETKVELNRKTGKVSCPIPELEAMAQQELDRALSERTTSDITGIIQRLFDDYAAKNPTGTLIPAREQGGAYLVLADHIPFVDRVESFLNALGGSMNRWPIPKGTPRGDKAAATSVFAHFKSLIEEHKEAIQKFGKTTRASTLEESAKLVTDTRVRLEAFSSVLGDSKGEIDGILAECKTILIDKVNEIVKGGETVGRGDQGHLPS